MTPTPWILEVFAIFCKKSSLPSFLPCASNSSRCSLVICFTLSLVWLLISAINVRYFSTSCNTLRNSVEEMTPSCIACEMILAMLSNLLWVSSSMESFFYFLMVKVLKDFCVIAVARERSTLVPLKAMPTGNPTSPANAAIEIPPVITVDVIKPVSTISAVILNRFIFLPIRSRNSISSSKCLNFNQFF